jgi:hypothetical protein
MKKLVIFGSLVAGLILSSCNSSNRVVSNFYEDGIYYNPAIGNIPSGSMASSENASGDNNKASAVDDYFDPNYKSQGPTIINNHFGSALTPMWGMGFNPLWSPWAMNPMWMSPGWSFGIGWGAGWGMGWSRWGMGFGPMWANNPWYWNPWMMNRMWMWDPWMYNSMMMWDPFWGHPMAWGNPWMNPWMPGFGWGMPIVMPPRSVNQVRGVRSGSYASTGSGIGRKSSEPAMPADRTSRLNAARTSPEIASPSAQSLSRLESASENPSSRLRASDLRATRDVVSSSQAVSRNNYADRLSTNSLQSSRATRSVEHTTPGSRQTPAAVERPARIYNPSNSAPATRSQSLPPATRQYQRGQMESIQSRPIQRQQNTWQNQAPASRPSFNHGGARQFNTSPSFNSGGATRGSSGGSGGRLR